MLKKVYVNRNIVFLILTMILVFLFLNEPLSVYATQEITKSISWEELGTIGSESSTNEYYFNQLSVEEKGFYEYERLLSFGGHSIALTGVPDNADNIGDLLNRAHAALLTDDPTYRMRWERGINVEPNNVDSSYTINITQNPIFTNYKYNKTLKRVDAIVNALEKTDDPYTKYMKLFNYRKECFSYDKYSPFISNKGGTLNDCAYGVFLNNNAVCAGLADALKMLCNEAEIPCIIVGNAGHAWNYIKLDNQWYSVDWSDTLDEILGSESHYYQGNSNYHLSDLYIGIPDDFEFPVLARENFEYKGDSKDFSLNVEETIIEETGDGFLYTVNEDNTTCTITGYDGAFSNYFEIPAEVNGLIVTRIDDGAFEDEIEIEGILELPDSINYIGDAAFKGCKGVTGVRFPTNLITIGRAAFIGCQGLSGSLQLPNNLKNLGDCAFYECTNLNDNVFIPDAVILDTAETFFNCKFKSFSISDTNSNYTVFDGVLYSKDGKDLISCPAGKEGLLKIKDGTVNVTDSSCRYCESISEISFPTSLKEIGNWAFQGTRFTGNLELPEGLETIGDQAFARDEQYPTKGALILPDSLKEIRAWAFTNCGFEGELTIPAGVTKINYTFEGTLDNHYNIFHANNFTVFNVYCTNDVAKEYLTNSLKEYGEEYFKDHYHVIHKGEWEIIKEATCTDYGLKKTNCTECNTEVEDVIPKLQHHIIRHEALPSTCTEDGNIEYWSCSECGKLFNDQDGDNELLETDIVIEATGHTEEVIPAVDPTCTEPGLTEGKRCSVCGEILVEQEEIAALGHDYHEVEGSAVEATCTEAGKEADKKCSRCDSVIEGKEIAALGHDWSEWKVTKEATEDEEGLEVRTCSRCEETESRTIPKLNHTHNLVRTEAVEATCTEDGNIEYWTCSKCGKFYSDSEGKNEITEVETVIKAAGHGEEDIPAVEPTCTEPGLTAGKRCPICGETIVELEEIPALGHDWTEWRVAKPATEEEEGTETRYCMRCGEDERREIPKLEHIHDLQKVNASEATCLDDGNIEYWLCSKCSKLYSDSEGKNEITSEETVVKAKGHKEEVIAAVDPTCTEPGLTEGKKCSVCERILEFQEEIPALGHDWGEWVTVKEATEEEEGLEQRTCSRCSETESRIIPKLDHVHKLVKTEAAAASCTENGNVEYWTCSKCGKFYSDKDGANEINVEDTVIPAVGHDFGEWTVTKEATCTDLGEEQRVCKHDSTHIEKRDIPANGHTAEVIPAVDPTCTEPGLTAGERCSVCGGILVDQEEVPALGHDWGEWVVVQVATEEEEGLEQRTCSRCNETESRSIPKLNHTHNLVRTEAVEATCTEDGNIEYWTCSKCGKFYSDSEGMNEINVEDTVIPAFGHNFGEWTVTKEATCTELGEEQRVCKHDSSHVEKRGIPAIGHTEEVIPAVDPTCTETGLTEGKRCSVCGEVLVEQEEVAALGHDWSEWKVTKEATEDEEGLEVRTCSRCEDTESRAIPKLNHTHNLEKTEAVAATCTTAGNIEYWSCSKCGKLYSDADGKNEITEAETIVKAKGHTEEVIPAVDPTCTESGLTEGKRCSACDEILVEQEEVPALGHDYHEVEGSAVAATCTKAGKEADKKCSRCDSMIEGKEVAALGHDWSEWKVTKEATEDEEGLEERTCSRCSESETRNIPKLDHVHKLIKTEAVAASCTEAGNTEYWTCSGCGRIFSDKDGANEINIEDTVITALGHDFSEWAVTIEATCTELGEEQRVCKHDTSHVEKRGIPATGHTEEVIPAVDPTCTEPGLTEGKRCSVCDEILVEQEEVAALGHDYHEVEESAVAATCTKAGKEADKKCSRCDSMIEGKEIAALGHDWSDWKVTKEATEDEDGLEVRTCSRCNETENRTIPKLSHTHNLVKTEAVAATCTEDGNSEYWTCSKCGKLYSDSEGKNEITEAETVVAAKGHTEELIPAVEPTCTESGLTEGKKCAVCGEILEEQTEVAALGHDYHEIEGSAVAATCTKAGKEADKKCSRCDSVIEGKEIAALGHDWSEWKVTKEATEEEEGLEVRTCSRCEETESRAIPKLNHTHDLVKTEAVAATCTEDGNIEYWTCSKCGKLYSDAEGKNEIIEAEAVVEAKGHTEELIPAIDPTCTEPGLTEGKKCAVCGEILVEQEEVPALGHDFGEWIHVEDSTCTTHGYDTHSCSRCGLTETNELDLAEHDWEDSYTVDVEPTCTTDGSQSIHCKNCDAVRDSEVIPAAGHQFGEWVVVQEPTYEADGVRERTCTVCGAVEQEILPMLERTSIASASVSNIVAKVYTGKALTQNPTVTLDGQTLKAGTDYELTYSNNKLVGTATVKITGIGAYKDSIEKTFKINPKGTSISKLTAAKKGFTAKWKKQATQITGYQLQYSTSKTFKSAKTVTIKSYKTLSKKVTKLKAKKRYYVRVRTYKTVDGAKYYSAWSSRKYVTTKK